ncbi:MAG: multiheme c-type cytochrome [Deltaproteobacteria bacterium]|nr:multiheme c-type cytochrome [Deltaproteobacteria bacterium]
MLLPLLLLAAACVTADPAKPPQKHAEVPATDFSEMRECKGCHATIYEQHAESMHATAYTNPVFLAQYYDLFMSRLHENPAAFADEPDCLACHAPVAFLRNRYLGQHGAEGTGDEAGACASCHGGATQVVGASEEGVACDFCHRIQGFADEVAGNGNYLASPGQPKFGPLKTETGWHHAYSELQTRSEFCAICHSSHNRLGLALRTTFDEWKESRFAREGIQCQDCHMNANGFLTEGKAVYEKGKAAQMTLGSAPVRERLYTHRFYGAHSASQVEGALELEIWIQAPEIRPGKQQQVMVRVFNDKTGHKMPSGSAELRVVYLDVLAKTEQGDFPLRCGGKLEPQGRSDAGSSEAIYGGKIPPGRRLYHAVVVDQAGERTFSLFDAAKMVFDNRLEAGEVRNETYYLRLPEEVRGEVTIEASLYYLRYPEVFARQLEVPAFEPVRFASAEKRTTVAVPEE